MKIVARGAFCLTVLSFLVCSGTFSDPVASFFIMFVRDGRDVAVSLRKRYGDFETGLRRWVDDNSLGLNWSDDPRVMKVRYEDLVKKHDETMPRICKFIGEAFEEGLIDYHKTPAYDLTKEARKPGSEWLRDHAENRTWQMSQKLFDGSGKWIKEMTEEEKTCFKADKEAIQMLIDFDYAAGDDW
jgi:hypothetical protein